MRQSVKILVVDDDATVREVLRLMLDLEGYEVLVAGGGEEALAIAESAVPDLILLDVAMPGLDGLQVFRRVKSSPWPIRVFVVSALDSLEDEHAALLAGADGFLRKPFSPLELLSIIGDGALESR